MPVELRGASNWYASARLHADYMNASEQNVTAFYNTPAGAGMV
jgi:hypothetical protein